MDATKNIEKIIEDYYQKVIEGLSFDEIRPTLQKQDFTEDEIKLIIRKVDDRVLAHDTSKPKSKFGAIIMWAGLGLMGIGVALTLANFYHLINLGNTYLNLYGPFIAGMIVYILGKNRIRKEQNG